MFTVGNIAPVTAFVKVLGATRGQILFAYGVEYDAVGVIAGVAGVALGAAAVYPVVAFVFHARWSLDVGGVAAWVAVTAGLAAVGGARGGCGGAGPAAGGSAAGVILKLGDIIFPVPMPNGEC
jgi:predicted lysophospholipase L1 biosynthesis ABC-type transport system permease subunit